MEEGEYKGQDCPLQVRGEEASREPLPALSGWRLAEHPERHQTQAVPHTPPSALENTASSSWGGTQWETASPAPWWCSRMSFPTINYILPGWKNRTWRATHSSGSDVPAQVHRALGQAQGTQLIGRAEGAEGYWFYRGEERFTTPGCSNGPLLS